MGDIHLLKHRHMEEAEVHKTYPLQGHHHRSRHNKVFKRLQLMQEPFKDVYSASRTFGYAEMRFGFSQPLLAVARFQDFAGMAEGGAFSELISDIFNRSNASKTKNSI